VTSLRLELPAELVDAIARQAADIAVERVRDNQSPWMTRSHAAAYLGLPLSRLEKDRRIPCHKDAGRVLYDRGELDAHFQGLDERG